MDFKELNVLFKNHGFTGMVSTTDPLKLSVERTSGVMSFADVVLIAGWLRDDFDWPVNFDHMTTTSVHFQVGVPISEGPEGLKAAAAELTGLSVAEWLTKVQGQSDAVETYSMFGHFDGEDVLPTRATDRHGFLWVRPADFYSTEKTGKWCIVRPASEIDALWAQVRQAVLDGHFRAALVSTPSQAASLGDTYVICAFTSDWKDQAEVNAARDVLRGFGVTESIGYKRDVETVRGVYGTPDEWTYHA